MLDAPPLENRRSSTYDRTDAFQLYESMLQSGSLPRHSSSGSANFDLANGSQPSAAGDSDAYRQSSTGMTAFPSQRQFSGGTASMSYLQPVRVSSQQPVSSSSQVAVPQVIDIDDDSPLPIRHRMQHNAFNGNELLHGDFEHQNSGSPVDLTGESPPVTRLPVRHHSNRINLESIGSGPLQQSSSEVGNQQNRNHTTQQHRRQQAGSGQMRVSDSTSSRSLYSNSDALQPGRLGSYATQRSEAPSNVFSQEAGDFLDISGLQSSQVRRGSNRQPSQRRRAASSQELGSLLQPR